MTPVSPQRNPFALFHRTGRFFVGLPNEEERKSILEIHLRKRHKWNRNIDVISLLNKTEDFSGADLEAVVKDTTEAAFMEGKTTITTEMLEETIRRTKSTKAMLSEKMDEITKRVAKMNIKSASVAKGEKPVFSAPPLKLSGVKR